MAHTTEYISEAVWPDDQCHCFRRPSWVKACWHPHTEYCTKSWYIISGVNTAFQKLISGAAVWENLQGSPKIFLYLFGAFCSKAAKLESLKQNPKMQLISITCFSLVFDVMVQRTLVNVCSESSQLKKPVLDQEVFFPHFNVHWLCLFSSVLGGKQKTTSEYLLADKSLPALPVAMSICVSLISSNTVLGNATPMLISFLWQYWMQTQPLVVDGRCFVKVNKNSLLLWKTRDLFRLMTI